MKKRSYRAITTCTQLAVGLCCSRACACLACFAVFTGGHRPAARLLLTRTANALHRLHNPRSRPSYRTLCQPPSPKFRQSGLQLFC
jgi:hypothetical protein